MNIELTQNTPEWLEFRRKKIGASDAPIILEVSTWKTPYQLWLVKEVDLEKYRKGPSEVWRLTAI